MYNFMVVYTDILLIPEHCHILSTPVEDSSCSVFLLSIIFLKHNVVGVLDGRNPIGMCICHIHDLVQKVINNHRLHPFTAADSGPYSGNGGHHSTH